MQRMLSIAPEQLQRGSAKALPPRRLWTGPPRTADPDQVLSLIHSNLASDTVAPRWWSAASTSASARRPWSSFWPSDTDPPAPKSRRQSRLSLGPDHLNSFRRIGGISPASLHQRVGVVRSPLAMRNSAAMRSSLLEDLDEVIFDLMCQSHRDGDPTHKVALVLNNQIDVDGSLSRDFPRIGLSRRSSAPSLSRTNRSQSLVGRWLPRARLPKRRTALGA